MTRTQRRTRAIALTLGLSLALLALQALLRRPEPGPAPDRPPARGLDLGAWILTGLVMAALALGLDSYRRADLRGARDGPLVLAFCREQIAHYKVPHYVRFVESFPLTVTGKVQKYLIRKQLCRDLQLQEESHA